MNILFIGAGSEPTIFIQRRIEALCDKKINVILPKTQTPEKSIKSLLNLIFLKPKRVINFFKILSFQKNVSLKTKIIKAIKYIDYIDIDFDIIHFQWIDSVESFDWLIDSCNVPVLSSVRGSMVTVYPYKNEIYRRKLVTSFRLSNYIHCVSEDLKEICVTEYNINKNKIFVNYNGINVDKFKPLNIGNKKKKDKFFRIVSVGAIMWRKGFLFQLLIMMKLKEYPIKLICIGDGIDYRYLEYQLNKMKLSNTVEFLGKKKEDEVIKYLQNSDIYLSTSVAEGLANSVMEAASCGLPSVVFEAEGMSEVILNNQTGYIVPYGDIDKMVKKILKLFNNRVLLKKISKDSRKYIVSNFNYLDQVEKMINKYNDIINEK